ncbi:amidohydrolase family protein [Malonomonas rubra]|uniref:amidohydrolase family protein n=1 Tax=Malonomonas rubra TaxID=57040 RepID=UPI0026E9EF4B|nr:amidohydrolase family protein [Malonomonas rubra]
MTKIYCAKYLVPGNAPPIIGGALLAVNGKIVSIGRFADLRRAHPEVQVVEFPDCVLLPLLVNAHTHLELTDFPLWAQQFGETTEPDNFVDWILRLVRVKRKLGKKAYSCSVANGIRQSLAAGTGAVGDILSQYSSRKVYQGTMLHGVLYLESLGHDPEIISRFRNELRSLLAEERVGLMQLGISPHSPYTISADYLKDVYEKCFRQNLPCSTHLAESPEEIEFVVHGGGDLAKRFYPSVGWKYLIPKGSGCRPAEYLHRHAGLFPKNLLVHGVQLSGREIELLAKQQMSLVLCPRSNAKLKVGKAPVAQLLQAGINLSLGTDSMASNDSLSVWDEIAFAHNWFGGECDAPTLLKMATSGGADALGLAAQLGSLEVGKLAEFQVLQPETAVAENEIFDYLVAPGRTEEIVQVFHQGETSV